MSAGHDDRGANRQQWRALAVCLTAGFMALLDVSIVNVALPSIRVGLGAGQDALQWIVSGYSLTFGLLLVPAGRLGDARDRRAVFMAGVSGFVLASAACGLATSTAWLVAARLAQGVAGGTVLPQVSGYIQESFEGPDRGRAFGLFGAVVGISTAIGPLLGGALIALLGPHDGWRWVFFVNLPIGVVAVLLAAKLLPKGRMRGEARQARLDPVAIVLLGGAVTAVLLPLIELRSWPAPLLAAAFVAAAVLLGCFVVWERRYQRRDPGAPLVALDLFGKRSYTLGIALAGCYFAGFTAIFFVLTLFLQNGEGFSALAAGAEIMPFALGSAASAAIAGHMVHRFGRRLVVTGLAVVLIGILATALAATLATGAALPWALAGPLLVAGLGSGAVISPNLTLTLSDVPVDRAGSAGGVVQTIQRMGAALGVAAIGTVLFDRLAAHPRDWAGAFASGFVAIAVAVAAALAVGVLDILYEARRARSQPDQPLTPPSDKETTMTLGDPARDSVDDEIQVQIEHCRPSDGDAVIAVLRDHFQADIPTTAPGDAGTSDSQRTRVRTLVLHARPGNPQAGPPVVQLTEPVQVDLTGPADAVRRVRDLLASTFSIRDRADIPGEHERELRLRLT